MQRRYLMLISHSSHGSVLSKNILSLKAKTNSPLAHMDGQSLVTQVTKDHITAQLEVMLLSEELFVILITKHAFTVDSVFLEQMLRSCQDNGSIKLDQPLVSNKEITSGCQDISS
jgi:hypothetical protein